jgi:selenocysteine-specific elongation factor
LREREELWQIEGGLLVCRAVREQLVSVVAGMRDDITVAGLRDALGVNRKNALAMLDFLDMQKVTRRVGDKRLLVSA